MKLRALATAAVALAGLAAPAARADEVTALRGYLREQMEETGVRGASVAWVRQGGVAWLEGFGTADERTGEPVTPRTVFQAASLGKVVAAYAALLRVADGDWLLDGPVASARLDTPPGCEPPTLRMLLSHTAGLGNDLRAPRFASGCELPAGFAYAGEGYLVLQDLFGDASGDAAEAFARARVFEPLGMTSATFRPPRAGALATGHADLLYAVVADRGLGAERRVAVVCAAAALVLVGLVAVRAARAGSPGRAIALSLGTLVAVTFAGVAGLATTVVPVAPWSDETLLPSSLHASADDMARFAAELLEPRLAPAAVRDALLEPVASIDERLAWTAGIGVDRVPTAAGEVATFWQWGSNPGFQGLLVLVPQRREALVVLTNTGGFADLVLDDRGGYVLSRRLARRVLGLEGRWTLRGSR